MSFRRFALRVLSTRRSVSLCVLGAATIFRIAAATTEPLLFDIARAEPA
jgi:hypothetical protein